MFFRKKNMNNAGNFFAIIWQKKLYCLFSVSPKPNKKNYPLIFNKTKYFCLFWMVNELIKFKFYPKPKKPS